MSWPGSMSNFKSKPTSIAKVYVQWGRIADSSRHPQPRPSLHQVWYIIRASMFNQDQTHASKNVPTVLQSQTQGLPSCCFNHWGRGGGVTSSVRGIASTWGKFTEFYWFYSSLIWQRKSPFLQNLLWIFGSQRTADVFYLSSLLSLRKTHFCREATARKLICLPVHRLDINGKMFCLFFSAADQVTLLE